MTNNYASSSTTMVSASMVMEKNRIIDKELNRMKKSIAVLTIREAGLITAGEMINLFRMLQSPDEENYYMAEKIIEAHLNTAFNNVNKT